MMVMFLTGYALGIGTLVAAAAAMDARKKHKAMRDDLNRQKLERWHREVYAPGFEFIELPREKFR